jgi:hypothetical protein
MSLYICTLAEIKTYLEITDTTDDTLLTLIAEGVQGRFDRECNRTFLKGDYTETFDGGAMWLLLDAYPVVSIASVSIGGTALASDGYTLNAKRGRLGYGDGDSRWPEQMQSIDVAYTGGYVAAGDTPGTDETAMPEALRRALLLQVGFDYRNRKTMGIAQVSSGGVSMQQGSQPSLALKMQTLLPEVVSTLNTFRRMG